MAFITGQGFMPYALKTIQATVGNNTAPPLKVDHVGLFRHLTDAPRKLELNKGGNIQQVQVKYKKRWNIAHTETVDDCTKTNLQPYEEASVNINNYRQLSITIDDATVKQYETEATESFQAGTPPTPLMMEMQREIMNAADGLLTGINQDLWGLMPASSINRRSGNTLDTINIPQNTTNLPLNQGPTQILEDMMENLFGAGKPAVVGSGLFSNFMMMQPAKNFGFNGYNTRIESEAFKFYFDSQAAALLGSNQIIVIDEGAIQLVEFMKFVGPFAGVKPGNSIFGTIRLPMQSINNFGEPEIKDVMFDWQLMYSPCSTTFTSEYYGTPITISRGFTLILSKTFGLFAIPADAYNEYIDPMYGNRGFLNYTITNN